MKIDRNDMLELTRRMTVGRSNFSRVAGCYVDPDGEIDGTFNRSFLDFKPSEKEQLLKLAKAIPYATTNTDLVAYRIPKDRTGANNIWQLLDGIKNSEMKNDALLDILYEIMADYYVVDYKCGAYVFYSCYDIPAKGSDHAEQWESEEVYQHLIFAFCPVDEDYNPGEPEYGVLYPLFANRSTDFDHIAIYDPKKLHDEMTIGLFKLVD